MKTRRGSTGTSTQLQQIPGRRYFNHPPQKLKNPYCHKCNHARYAHHIRDDGVTKCVGSCRCTGFAT